jgi:putative Mg2+ transporter-C (MgtC) family protein
MPTNLVWSDVTIRLLCTLAAAGIIGYNRGEHGRPAGLRTTILVALAACLAMIEANYLNNTMGKTPGSMAVMDTMRFPLCILSGIGFIGAGAIIRRDNYVVGITTAATIWFVTMIGLCFGGGQIALGLVGSAIGIVTLTALKLVEERMKQDHQGKLALVMDEPGLDVDDLRARLAPEGVKISSCAFAYSPEARSRELNCDLQWTARADDHKTPPVIHSLAHLPGIVRLSWTPQAK